MTVHVNMLYAQDREMAIAAGDQESTTAGAGAVAMPKHNDLDFLEAKRLLRKSL